MSGVFGSIIKLDLVLILMLISIAGCSSKPTIKLYPVQGKLLVSGQPVIGAVVGFHPVAGDFDDKGTRPAGVVGDDGSFKVSTFGVNDGAPAGEYTLSIFWPQFPGKDDPGPDRLKGKYANPKTSNIRVKVEEQANELDVLDLKK